MKLIELTKILIRRPCGGYYLRWYYNGWHYWLFYPGAQKYKTDGEDYRTLGIKRVNIGSGPVSLNQCKGLRTVLSTTEISLYTDGGWKSVRVDPGTFKIAGNGVDGYEIELILTIGSRELSVTGFSPAAVIPIAPEPTFCERIIGTQIWMCKNWDAILPGSTVYDTLESNRDIYGGLYSYDQIMSSGFIPTGWHVPTQADWQTLIDYVGGESVAAGKLKEIGTTHWDSPNTDATNDYSFTALGGGSMEPQGEFAPEYAGLKEFAKFWTSGYDPDSYERISHGYTSAFAIKMTKDSAATVIESLLKNSRLSVRLIKDTPYVPILFDDWFLPSKDELNAMYTELYLYGVGILEIGGAIPSFVSSSEYDNMRIWAHDFDSPIQSVVLKNENWCAWPIRSFTSNDDYSLRDIGPSGGWIFYKNGNNYLEACSSYVYYMTWSNIIDVAIGTTGTAIGTGQSNTTAIIAQSGHTNSVAKLCDDLEIYH